MAENTAIEWCDHTFNPWEGCQKVGPGCDHCYAETRNARFGGGVAVNWGPGAPRRRTSESNWGLPLKWNRQAQAERKRFRVFCASLADWLDNAVEIGWLVDLLDVVRLTPNLDWLLLSKRIGTWRARMQEAIVHAMQKGREILAKWIADWVNGKPPVNVVVLATIVDQNEADRDIPKLLAVPARRRGLSIEPMLGPIDLTRIEVHGGDAEIYPLKGTTECVNDEGEPAEDLPAIDWAICGGESGHHARPMHPDWARSVRDQCAAAGVPFLFKQWGEWAPDPTLCTRDVAAWSADACSIRVGKKAAGRLLDGIEHNGFPEAM